MADPLEKYCLINNVNNSCTSDSNKKIIYTNKQSNVNSIITPSSKPAKENTGHLFDNSTLNYAHVGHDKDNNNTYTNK